VYDPEAIIQDADFEQADLEAAGRAASRAMNRSERLRAAGKLAEAAAACPHSWSGCFDASDPRHGQAGRRCYHCGTAFAPGADLWAMGPIIAPCETPPTCGCCQ